MKGDKRENRSYSSDILLTFLWYFCYFKGCLCVFCLCLMFSDSTRNLIIIRTVLIGFIGLFHQYNSVGSESPFDYALEILLLLVNNNWKIPS